MRAGAPTAGTSWRRKAAGLVAASRPRQWVKNLACSAGLIFSGRLFEWVAVGDAALATLGFCLASSSVYLLNDVCDRRDDAANPRKRTRPIASGVVPVGLALIASAILALAALASTAPLPRPCTWILAAYLAMTAGYSLRLKHTVLLDVILIALGFVLRILDGVYAVSVPPSPWIVLCMFFLALFLGFAKRRSELGRGEDADPRRRPVLVKYRTDFLDQLLGMTATTAILCYTLYTLLGRPGGETLVVTVPLVVYGIYRYLLLVVVHEAGGAPDRDLLEDPLLVATVILWVSACVLIIYLDVNLIHFVPAR